MSLTTKINQPYQVGIIVQDYINLSNELIAQEGAAGLIVGQHNGRLMMSFENDNSGKHVGLDGSGRKVQSIPIHLVELLSESLIPTFDQIISSYKRALLSYLLHHGDAGAMQVSNNAAAVLMDDNQNVGFILFDEIGSEDPVYYLRSDWDESVGNWKEYDEPHTTDLSVFPMLSYDVLIKQAEQEIQAQSGPQG